MKSYIEIAVKAANGQRSLARMLGVSPSYVHKMVKTNHVPAEQCRKIEAITGGKVTAEQLRPDIFLPIKY